MEGPTFGASSRLLTGAAAKAAVSVRVTPLPPFTYQLTDKPPIAAPSPSIVSIPMVRASSVA